MSNISLEAFTPDMIDDVSMLLARAFVSNPLHVAAFGANQQRKNEAFFRTIIAFMKGPKYVAIMEKQIVGFNHWVHSPACQLTGIDKVKMFPHMLSGYGLIATFRVASWASTWSKHDPDNSHSHLGPIGVDPSAQGKGIGSLLMKPYCDELDNLGMEGYLETDRPENVPFYNRYGFITTQELPILGVTNFLMRREKRADVSP